MNQTTAKRVIKRQFNIIIDEEKVKKNLVYGNERRASRGFV